MKYSKFLKPLMCIVFALVVLCGSVSATTQILNVCDLNADGSTNNRDAALLIQYINKWDVQLDETVADFNADGNINNKDYCLLLRYICGWGKDSTANGGDGIELPTDEWLHN